MQGKTMHSQAGYDTQNMGDQHAPQQQQQQQQQNSNSFFSNNY